MTATAFLGGWLGTWAGLTLATAIAGGSPTASPVALLRAFAAVEQLRELSHGALWTLVDPRRQPDVTLFWVAVCSLLLVDALLALSSAALFRRGASARARLHTTTSFASRWDLRKLGKRRAGSFLLGSHVGRVLHTEAETSVLVIGPTRSGKTTSLIVPNLLRWAGPAVATSTKDELVRITVGARQRRGPVYIYDPTGDLPAGIDRASWSPLSGCESLDHAWRVAAWLAA
jgi:hypothetical protein